MRDAGLTHGGFYKHFGSKDELLTESLSEAFREIADRLTQIAEKSKPGTAWKAIVKAYLSPEHCDHAERGCPLAALAPELARAGHAMKASIRREIIKYKSRMLPLMPGRRVADKERAFFAIFSTMIGAVAIARILPDQASTSESARERTRLSPAQLLKLGGSSCFVLSNPRTRKTFPATSLNRTPKRNAERHTPQSSVRH